MAGRPPTRARRDPAPPLGGPLDWAEHARPGVLPPMNGNGNGHGAAPPRSMLDEIGERRRRSMERQTIDAEMDEESAETALRNRRRQFEMTKLEIQEQQLMERLMGGGKQDTALADVIHEMNVANEANFQRLVQLLGPGSRKDSEISELTKLVQGLEQRLQQALDNPRAQNDPFGTSGLEQALTVVDRIEAKIKDRLPAPPAAEPGMSREQVLRQINLEEEADLRRAELKERREDREFAREQARDQAASKRARLASTMGMVDQYLGPTLAAIMGSKAREMLSGGDGAKVTASATVDNSRKPYQCPECGTVSWANVDVHLVQCPGCGLELDPFPMAAGAVAGPADDQPHHHHEHLAVMDGGEEGV